MLIMPHMYVLWRLQIWLKLHVKWGHFVSEEQFKIWRTQRVGYGDFFQWNFQEIILIRANLNTEIWCQGYLKRSHFLWRRWLLGGGCGGGGIAAAVHSATAAGDGQGKGEVDVDRGHRTRGWHNERTERGNLTNSWAEVPNRFDRWNSLL